MSQIIRKKYFWFSFLFSAVLLVVSALISSPFFYQQQVSGQTCSCHNDCNPTNPRRCEGSRVVECNKSCNMNAYQSYYAWCTIQDCSATGQTCQNGACTGTCVSSCQTGPGCRASLANGQIVSGNCCGNGYCYTCMAGYTWDGLACNASNICAPDGCNGNCPANCAVAQDPDCACQTGNGCCGINCINTNDSDCPATCTSTCSTGPRCRNSLTNGSIVAGNCCGNGSCYDCNSNYAWNGSVCVLSSTCTPNGCNGNCPAGCTVAQDPDCGCQDSNSCCGIGCTNAGDNDCLIAADSVSPTVATFTAIANVSAVNINYTVVDTGGSHIDRVEVWRAADNGSNAPNAATWTEVNSLRQTITIQNLDNYTHAVVDTPGNGAWWYGIHVVDQANPSNMGTEDSPIKVTIAAAVVCAPNGCNGNCPVGCTVAQDPDCACQAGNGCCGLGCTNANDSDCPVGCTPTCTTGPGCRNSLANGNIVNGNCCGSGSCYGCNAGYTWNGLTCALLSACTPNGCNGNCPAGCTVAQDPDCGCQTGNNCCGIGCKKVIDDECPIVGDNISPTISSFTATAQFNSNSVYIHFSVLDSGGSFLDRVEVWRAPDSAGAPGSWQKMSNISRTIATRNLNSYNTGVDDNPSNGTWWYGLHVFDQAGNQTNENSPINVIVNGSSTCTKICNTGPGCTNNLTNGSVVAGNCCGTGSCYECNAGYNWILDNRNLLSCVKNCTTNLDCPSSQICCGNGICTTPNCVNNSSCGNSGNNCNPRVCVNPNTCGSLCSWSPVTTCQNNDGCCVSGCSHANDNDCSVSPSIKITALTSSSTNKAIFMASEPVVLNSIVTGGTPPFTYSWVGQSGNIGNQANLSIANPGIGTYPITLTIVDANNHSTTTPTFTFVVLSDTFDWSHRLLPSAPPAAGNWMTPIKNQGVCGSCWDFSTLGAVEGQYKIQQNDASSASNLDLSEQYLLGCPGSGGNCGGGWAGAAASFLKSTGTPAEICFPYQAQNSSCPTTCTDNSAISYWRIQNHNFVSFSSGNPNVRRREMKEALVKQGPVIVSMYILGWNAGTFQCADNNLTDHSVVIVGYDDSQGVWIVRNSWGASWNGNGYFKVAYNNCSIEKTSCLTIGQVYKY